MITVYVPQNQVPNQVPSKWSLTPKTGWAQMQICKETYAVWTGTQLPEENKSTKQILLG